MSSFDLSTALAPPVCDGAPLNRLSPRADLEARIQETSLLLVRACQAGDAESRIAARYFLELLDRLCRRLADFDARPVQPGQPPECLR